MSIKIFFNNSGQTVLESLIALSLLVIVLGAISVAVLTSLNNSSFIKQQNQASKFAQQGMEYLRDQIVNNNAQTIGQNQSPFTGTLNTGSRCLDSNNFLKANPCNSDIASDIINGAFKREVTFSSGNCGVGGTIVNGVEVVVTVSWTSGKCDSSFCNKESVKSCFQDPSRAFPTTIPTTYQGI